MSNVSQLKHLMIQSANIHYYVKLIKYQNMYIFLTRAFLMKASMYM